MNRFSINAFLDQHYNRVATEIANNESDERVDMNVTFRLWDHGEEETIAISHLTPSEIARLRSSDPFSYFSILTSRRGTSYCDLSISQTPHVSDGAGEGDASAGGFQSRSVRSASHQRNRVHSFDDTLASQRQLPKTRAARRSSMPNLDVVAAAPAVVKVKRRRRFATEADAIAVHAQMLGENTRGEAL